ncbi:11-beta-hydroxysteroid dehydrogenase A isoform X2 [Manihot esculenta]|uniref:11-beta-hydroxysteroid dehydrogenase A isoform X2 n=1 Tax=Manihot esculenta TaxID=3983 RepID=UPI001CC3798C|nr:11-beta-hydroxysteroid dehydrogenase A isoform X2 [Manihot esculenta]
MDLVHKLLNVLLPLISTFVLLCFLPIYLVFKFLSYIKRHIYSEDVSGKVVLITGAASGIGEQISYEYAKRGACLVLVDVREDGLEAVVKKAKNFGSPDVIAIAADVSKVEDAERFVNAAVEHFGRLDHLVNNAGVGDPDELRKNNNILQPRRVMASKAALINFYESLRSEIGHKVRITIVTPGLIKTRMTENLAEKGYDLSFLPSTSKQACAKAIVKSGCRGDKYLTEPSWIRALYPWKVLCPEVTEFCNRFVIIKWKLAWKKSLTRSPQPKID